MARSWVGSDGYDEVAGDRRQATAKQVWNVYEGGVLAGVAGCGEAVLAALRGTRSGDSGRDGDLRLGPSLGSWIVCPW